MVVIIPTELTELQIKGRERAQGCERQTPLNVGAGLTELHLEQLGMTFHKMDFLSSVLLESIFRTLP